MCLHACFRLHVYVFFDRWIEACVKEQLPPTTELEEGLRNGVALAKLAHYINPDLVPAKKIYDKDESKYQVWEEVSFQ